MGFYIRKTVKFGPLRFNLSNSGIGVSTGTKGLRVGVDGKGRTYVGGGKGILRYRKQLANLKKDDNYNENGFWKIIALLLLVAFILTVVYFIKPEFINEFSKFILEGFSGAIR